MRDISWDNDSAVTEVSGELVINGEAVRASDLSVRRSIPSTLPDQVGGVGGYEAASGSATVSQSSPVATQTPTPWGAQTAQPLDAVEVYARAGTSRARIFTGVVDKVSGAASDPDTGVSLVDISDRLNRAVSLRPMCKIMPAPTTDGSTNERNCDLVSTYLVDQVLRECGFYATPRRVSYCVMSAPLMGSTWPEVGTLLTSGRDGSHKLSPYWGTASWGVLANSVTATYAPDYQQWANIPGTLTRPMEIVVCAGNQQSASGRVNVEWANGGKYSMVVTSSRSVLVQVQFASSSEWQTILSATTATLGAWRTATARLTPLEGSKLQVEIRTNNGGYAKHSGSTIPYRCTVDPINEVRLAWSENQIGGVQVGFPGASQAFSAASHTLTARLTPPLGFYSLTGSPAVAGATARDLLTEWAKAECAAAWIDEDGVFNWFNRERFTSGAPVAELTSTNDLLDLQWSHDIQGAAARAVIKHKTVGVQRSKRSRIQVWQGGGQTMDPGDVQEEIVAVPDDEAWIGLDTTLDVFQAETLKRAFNKGEGSWGGYVAYDANNDRHGNTEYVGYTVAIGNVGLAAYKITQLWDGNVPSGVSYIKLSTQDDSSVLKPQWQGFNLPVLRAQCRLRFVDAQRTATASGPADAPDLVHDAGWWVQHPDAVRALAYWLAQRTARPLPVVDGVEISADARLMLGDKITVTDSHRTGTKITGVIQEIDQDIAAGDHTMTLRLVVTDVLATRPTLYEYDRLWSGATLEERDLVWADKTLGEFDAAPLARR